jgi:hypothetical protein
MSAKAAQNAWGKGFNDDLVRVEVRRHGKSEARVKEMEKARGERETTFGVPVHKDSPAQAGVLEKFTVSTHAAQSTKLPAVDHKPGRN